MHKTKNSNACVCVCIYIKLVFCVSHVKLKACFSKVDAQLLVVQKLEEKEGILQSSLATLEKELAVRTQALELNKRKVRSTSQMCIIYLISFFLSFAIGRHISMQPVF